jgi:hypothetical protein
LRINDQIKAVNSSDCDGYEDGQEGTPQDEDIDHGQEQ